MKGYLLTIISLLGKIFKSFLEVILSLLIDLKSFRNKLVFFTCVIVLIIILLDTDYRVTLASLGLFEFFICYYFNNRKVKDASIVEKITDKLK